MEDHDHVVEEILDQWYGSEDIFFKVRSDDGNVYLLRRKTSVPDGLWELVAYRQNR